MSGGVDSTSTALLLKDHYNVTGFFMQLAQPDIDVQIERVQRIAARIGIPLQIVDLTDAFDKCVLDYFSTSYMNGLTPNPCVRCNREIKFGRFLDIMLEFGMNRMATGHYARVVQKNGVFRLLKGADGHKDQSYFLSRLDQGQLARLLFPLGKRVKEHIYDFVEEQGFDHFRGEESQDVCFLQNGSVADFLQRRSPHPFRRGSIIDLTGKILGEHRGIANYTIGQRRGLGIADSTPYYVVAIDGPSNTIIVGKNDELLKEKIDLQDLHWITGNPAPPNHLYQVKIRSTHKGCNGVLKRIADDHYQVHFTEPQRAITPGQFGVIYDDDEVVGSGVIASL